MPINLEPIFDVCGDSGVPKKGYSDISNTLKRLF
jgi:hypothetical protein